MKHSFMGNLTRIMAALLFIGSAHAASDTTFDNALMPHIIMHYVLKCQAQEAPLSEALQRYCNELQTGEIQTTTEDHALIAHELLTHFDTVRTYLQNLYRTWLAVGEIPEHYRALTRAVNCDTASVLGLITTISDSLTTCCDQYGIEFSGTWTALATLDTDITTCCSTQQANFVSTWTIINSLPSSASVCGPVTVIRQSDIDAGNYTITTSGNYCLGEDISYSILTAITISAPNVFLDMNNHELLASSPSATGIQISDSFNDITITNGTFTIGAAGIFMLGSNNTVTIENCIFQTIEGGFAINGGGGTAINHTISNCIIRDSDGAIDYAEVDTLTVRDCVMTNLLSGAILPFEINGGSNVIIENCIIDFNAHLAPLLAITNVQNISIHNCLLRGNPSGIANADGIILTGCTSVNVSSCLVSSCLNLGGIIIAPNTTTPSMPADATITECYTFDNSNGIQASAPNVVIDTCITSRNIGVGIIVNNTNSNATNCIVQNCVISNNASIGIQSAFTPLATTFVDNIIINNFSAITSSGSNATIEDNIVINGALSVGGSASNNFIRNNEVYNSSGFGSFGGTNNNFYNNNAFNSTSGSGYGTITNFFDVNTDTLQGLVSDVLSNLTNT